MTDKQIIIDGVDVSGCLFYQTNFEEDYDVKIKHYCSNWHNSCESNNNSNCYYKQLLRKEQECEELKKDNATLFDKAIEARKENTTLQVQLDQLKQTLTEIKVLSENVYCLTNALNRDMALFAKQIIQKISEVEDVCNT